MLTTVAFRRLIKLIQKLLIRLCCSSQEMLMQDTISAGKNFID